MAVKPKDEDEDEETTRSRTAHVPVEYAPDSVNAHTSSPGCANSSCVPPKPGRGL